jgi:hypothetical protein
MDIQEAIKSGKPFRRMGWVDDDVFVIYDSHDIVLTIESDPLSTIELDVQDILAEDWYTREDDPVQHAPQYTNKEFAG